nr:universal stress protein [Dissulfurirhabdus thermomarina]
MIAGAGKTARELLRRLGQSWDVTLLDQDEGHLGEHRHREQVRRLVLGDASSRVILDEAGIAGHDFVAAVTNRDEVNLEVCRYARKVGVQNVIALVNDSLNLPQFQELGVRAICPGHLVARDIELFLESPRLFVSTIAEGAGEVMEVEVVRRAQAAGRAIKDFASRDWLIAAVHRAGQLIIPHGDTVIRAGDRLTIVGRADLYRSIAHFFSLAEPSFPLEYGQHVLLPLGGVDDLPEGLLDEVAYLLHNTRANGLTVLCAGEVPPELEAAKGRFEELGRLQVRVVTGSLEEVLVQTSKGESVGCVVSAPRPLGPVARILGIPTVVALAHRLACPLLVGRRSLPYRRILVPCSGTKSTGLALETAVDLAKQLGAEVTAVTVTDPLAASGTGSPEWAEEALTQARQIGKLQQFSILEVIRDGNPIKEILAEAADHDLLVVGSTSQSASLLRPHIGEHLVQDAPCSVLVVT